MAKSKLPERTDTASDVIEALEISRATLDNYIKRGCPCTKRGRGKPTTFDVGEVVLWREEQGLDGTVGRKAEPRDDELTKWRIAKEKEMAENWRLRNMQIKGEMLHVGDVLAKYVEVGVQLRRHLHGIPMRLLSMPGLSMDRAQKHRADRDMCDTIDDAIRIVARAMEEYGRFVDMTLDKKVEVTDHA